MRHRKAFRTILLILGSIVLLHLFFDIRRNYLPRRICMNEFPPATIGGPHFHNVLLRILELELKGYATDISYGQDLHIAGFTTWWGRCIRSDDFWKNRPIWLDQESVTMANRLGRELPPIPNYRNKFLNTADRGHVKRIVTGEWSSPPFYVSQHEENFWKNNTYPLPPESIYAHQRFCIRSWMSVLKHEDRILDAPIDAHLDMIERDRADSTRTDDRMPEECYSPSAYFWMYVEQMRHDYEQHGNLWHQELAIPMKLITDPLSESQIQEKNAWKITYLKRLRTEGWDELYIQAYKKAWDLPEEDF